MNNQLRTARLNLPGRGTRGRYISKVAGKILAGAVGTACAVASVTIVHPAGAGAATLSTVTYAFTEDVTVPSIHGSGHAANGTVAVSLDPATGNFTAQASRPSITVYGLALGLIPVSAVASFEQVGTFAGTIGSDGSLVSNLQIDIHLNAISLLGILPIFTSTTCHTAAPVALHPVAPAGGFSVAGGGTVTATFTVGQLTDCGAETALLNSTIPGPGNQVKLQLSPTS